MNNAVRHFLDLDQIDPDTLKSILKKAHALRRKNITRRSFLPGYH